MRLLILLWFLLLFEFNADAQLTIADGAKYADSLEAALHTTTSDSIKARINFLLADYWSYTDTAKGSTCLEAAKSYAHKNPFLNALYFFYKGQLIYSYNFSISESSYKKADSLLQQFNSKEAYLFRARAWYNYGALQQLKDNNRAFLNALLQKAVPLAIASEDTSFISNTYTNVGLIFMNQHEYGKADLYYSKAIGILTNKANAHSKELLYADILASKNNFFRDSILTGKFQLDEAKKLLLHYPASDYSFEYYESEYFYYEAIKQYANALQSIDSGLVYATLFNNTYSKENFLFLKYKAYNNLRNYKEAKNVIIQLVKNPVRNSIQNRALHYSSAAATYYQLKLFDSAYILLHHYSNIRDSLYENEIVKQLNDLESKFNRAEKEKQILQLQSEKDKAALLANKNKTSNQLLLIACLFLVTIIIVSFIYHKRLDKQNKLNHQQHLKEIEQANELKLTQAMLDGEEKERQRLARDLHDGLGGMLAGIKINLSGEKMKTTQTLDTVINQLDESLSELRRIARNMMPESLLRLGLATALQDLCESLMSDNIRIEFLAYGIQKEMEITKQLNIYRIVQEILSNAIKHANASKILIQCSQNENIFFLTVEDNGSGFDISNITSAKGIGFSNIKNRVAYLKGKIYIDSKINEGTIINIELNVHE